MIFVDHPKKFCDFCCISGDKGFHAGDNAFGIRSIAQIAKDILKKKVLHFCGNCHQRNPIQTLRGGPANCGNRSRSWQKHGYTLTHRSWPSWMIPSKFHIITLIKTSYYRVKMIWNSKIVVRADFCPHGISPFPTLRIWKETSRPFRIFNKINISSSRTKNILCWKLTQNSEPSKINQNQWKFHWFSTKKTRK